MIAIIAILAAILFPVFAKAREQARKASCLSNLKQIGTAAMMYSQDYDEYLPSVPFGNYPAGLWGSPLWNDYGWTYIFPLLDPYTKNTGIYGCPSAPKQFFGPANNRANITYAYNEYLYDMNRGQNSLAYLTGTQHGVANIAILADSRFAGIFNDWDAGGTGTPGYPQVNYLARVQLANGSNPRHEGSNFLFADGHAKFYGTGQIVCPQAQGATGQRPIVNPNAPMMP